MCIPRWREIASIPPTLLLTGILLTGCASSGSRPVSLHAAGPLVVCGVTVSSSPAGAFVYDITSKGFKSSQVVTYVSTHGDVYVRVAEGCDQGSTVAITPSDAFAIVRAVSAKDGRPVLVILKPLRGVPAELVARRHEAVVGTLKLDILSSEIGT
jgi:hypothetical protein